MRRPAPAPVALPKPRVEFYAFQSPLGYPIVARTSVEMVDRLEAERRFLLGESLRAACPAPYANWGEVFAKLDKAVADLEGVDVV